DTNAAPDPSSAEAGLRERVAAAGPAGSTPASRERTFIVRMGPLPAPIDAAELDMMLAGLGEMGSIANQAVDNAQGGFVAFDLTLEGTETDLRSVLALVVPPDLTSIKVAN